MARYHTGFTTPAAAAAAAFVDFRTSSTDRVRVLEIGIFNTAATTAQYSLERSTTLGTASTTVVPVAGEPSDPAATMLVGTAWSVAPASTSVPIRKLQVPAQIGAGVIWTFAFGDLVIPVSASLVIMNRAGAAGPICTGYIVTDE